MCKKGWEVGAISLSGREGMQGRQREDLCKGNQRLGTQIQEGWGISDLWGTGKARGKSSQQPNKPKARKGKVWGRVWKGMGNGMESGS